MNTAYFDCNRGISGNRIIGALLDGGYPLDALTNVIRGILPTETYEFQIQKITFNQRTVTFFDVILPEYDPSLTYEQLPKRSLSDIIRLISESSMDDWIKTKSIAIFQRLAQAEAEAHQCDIEEIDFHERGAIDTIIDVVGSVSGLHYFQIKRILSSPLNVGFGTIRYRYGTLPIPAPATQRLIKDVPVYVNEVGGELVTPTGAAILTTLCDEYQHYDIRNFDLEGYGLGKPEHSLEDCLRVSIIPFTELL